MQNVPPTGSSIEIVHRGAGTGGNFAGLAMARRCVSSSAVASDFATRGSSLILAAASNRHALGAHARGSRGHRSTGVTFNRGSYPDRLESGQADASPVALDRAIKISSRHHRKLSKLIYSRDFARHGASEK